jgi:hypothetical protein
MGIGRNSARHPLSSDASALEVHVSPSYCQSRAVACERPGVPSPPHSWSSRRDPPDRTNKRTDCSNSEKARGGCEGRSSSCRRRLALRPIPPLPLARKRRRADGAQEVADGHHVRYLCEAVSMCREPRMSKERTQMDGASAQSTSSRTRWTAAGSTWRSTSMTIS